MRTGRSCHRQPTMMHYTKSSENTSQPVPRCNQPSACKVHLEGGAGRGGAGRGATPQPRWNLFGCKPGARNLNTVGLQSEKKVFIQATATSSAIQYSLIQLPTQYIMSD